MNIKQIIKEELLKEAKRFCYFSTYINLSDKILDVNDVIGKMHDLNDSEFKVLSAQDCSFDGQPIVFVTGASTVKEDDFVTEFLQVYLRDCRIPYESIDPIEFN